MAPDPNANKDRKRKREIENVGKLSEKKAHAVPPSLFSSSSSSSSLAQPLPVESEPLDTAALNKINEEVRAHFKQGYKSNNKLYGLGKKGKPAMTGGASVEQRRASSVISTPNEAARRRKLSVPVPRPAPGWSPKILPAR